MIQLGNYNTLRVLRETSVGVFLGDDDVDDLLLPMKYVPENLKPGDEIKVFCYLDHEERPIATTLEPFVLRDQFACLRVAQVNNIGAFLDWGLEKHLLVPFREQRGRMQEGNWYVVYCYLDEKSFRLVASARLDRFVSKTTPDLKPGEEVDILLARKSDLGWNAIVNNTHIGLVYNSEIFQEMAAGDQLKAYVKRIRPDNKIDLSLRVQGIAAMEPAADQVLELLKRSGGYLPLHDKSDPEEIKAALKMSKKMFKKAIGNLYRARRISIKPEGIYLVEA